MIDCPPASISFKTPSSSWRNNPNLMADNPFDAMPTTPRVSRRVSVESTKRLLSSLDSLAVPSLDGSDSPSKMRKHPKPIFTGSAANRQSFDAALQILRNGNGRFLDRLQVERDAATSSTSTPTATATTSSIAKTETKEADQSKSAVVTLSKSMPLRRNSGVALSA